ncbi:putative 28S ribosomal protein S24-A, mitochondrial [Apostichopus japonicus]|uniref:Putative 28S ribosomal protein S24-A, mitochondrial n=1 Tax=Stichopus japonicus TaxID=307972 RepID=A0A2G8LNQ6_STIJA|nr:putative 28S ribosomal protein S24-A, mitochondrial [Apostichopus japonicus]
MCLQRVISGKYRVRRITETTKIAKNLCGQRRTHHFFSAFLKIQSTLLATRILSQSACIQTLHTSVPLQKVKAGRVKISKGEKPITYEQANFPFTIGVKKNWNSHHTGNLKDEEGAAERALEDFFLRNLSKGPSINV